MRRQRQLLTERQNKEFEELLIGVLRLWYVLIPVGLIIWGVEKHPLITSITLGLLVVVSLWMWKTQRPQRFWEHLAWSRACIDACLVTPRGDRPRIKNIERLDAGKRFTVKVPRGMSVKQLEKGADVMASSLGIMEVRVMQDRLNAKLAEVTLMQSDPFHGMEPVRWPNLNEEKLTLWDSIPMGVDEYGAVIGMKLDERNVLIGGEPGSGKSCALSLVCATGCMDPNVKVWLLDGKMVELTSWEKCAAGAAGADGKEAVAILRRLQADMNDRYKELRRLGLRKVTKESKLPLHLVVCDELAFYLQVPARTVQIDFAELMRDLVARGRAAGIICVAATQKPSHDIVPTALRDLFGFRLALRCNNSDASNTILGTGWASSGFDASDVPGGQRGVGFLLSEDAKPVKIKGFHLSDSDVSDIAAKAHKVRFA